MSRGRKRKPIEEHILKGTFHSTRHADRLLAPQAIGAPVKPSHLEDEAAEMWDFLAPKLAENGTVKAQDSSALTVVCEMWWLYRKAMAVVAENPTDKDARIAVLGYKTAWETSASKLGLNPTDRQRIKSDVASNKPAVKSRVRA